MEGVPVYCTPAHNLVAATALADTLHITTDSPEAENFHGVLTLMKTAVVQQNKTATSRSRLVSEAPRSHPARAPINSVIASSAHPSRTPGPSKYRGEPDARDTINRRRDEAARIRPSTSACIPVVASRR